MSSGAHIITTIMELIELKSTLNQLKAQYEEASTMTTCDGIKHNVEIIIKDPNGHNIGVQKSGSGEYQFITDTTGLKPKDLKAQNKFVNAIKQKYAYNKVIAELKRQGYQIAQEQKVDNDTIKLVARRWK